MDLSETAPRAVTAVKALLGWVGEAGPGREWPWAGEFSLHWRSSPCRGLLVQCRLNRDVPLGRRCPAQPLSHLSSLKNSCQGTEASGGCRSLGSEAAQLGLAAAPGKADENWCLSELDRFIHCCFGSPGKGEASLSAPDPGEAAQSTFLL